MDERIASIAAPLFARAVAQGMNAPFSLDAAYWGRDYAEQLIAALAAADNAEEKGNDDG